jgi:hypothetical protein
MVVLNENALSGEMRPLTREDMFAADDAFKDAITSKRMTYETKGIRSFPERSCERYVTSLVGHGIAKTNVTAGTLYSIDTVELMQHLRSVGFGTTIDVHTFDA